MSQKLSFSFDQWNALNILYTSTQGENWIWMTPFEDYGYPWNFSHPYANPCTNNWQGIGCVGESEATTVIFAFSFRSMNLNGSIANDFFTSFPNLTYIDMSGNFLNSTIPQSLFELPSLTYVDLAWNSFGGTISTCINQLSDLQVFDVSHNLLSGSLPTEFSELIWLNYLDLSANFLNGNFSTFIQSLSRLQYLDLSINSFWGNISDDIIQPSLSYLNLSFNYFDGPISASIGNLTSLQVLDLQFNAFFGTVPDSIGGCTSLNFISFAYNRLSGWIPSTVQNLKDLVIFSIVSNQFSGYLPVEITSINTLKYLYLFSNLFSGTIPSSIGNLTELVYLYLGNNLFHGSIPPEFGRLQMMEIWEMTNCLIDGSIPSVLGTMINVKYLELSYNSLTGSIPSLANLFKLQTLYLDGNHFEGHFPLVSNPSRLAVLDISYNCFTGTLPTTIWDNINLLIISLHNNFLEGSISSTISQIYQSFYVDLNYNMLSGTIPPTLGDLPSLKFLQFGHNSFHGTLPPSLGNLSELQIFHADSNFISGTIPREFGNLRKLVILALTSNFLIGTIPPDLSSIKSFSLMFLNNNKLHGNLVSQLAPFSGVTMFSLSSNDFTGEIASFFNIVNRSLPIEVFDITGNSISGSLPQLYPFHMGLKTFSISVNNFEGSIPSNYCLLPSLKHLFMDGLSAHSPRKSLVSGIGRRHGAIPSCLFSMRSLQALYLSGNKFVGSIPELLSENSSSLSHLVLSHNNLYGKVPNWIWQKRNWMVLDLSFNKFEGHIEDSPEVDYSNDMSISLQQNRFSGNIPVSMKNIESINILNGNIFSCNLAGSTLPNNDPYLHSYVCGSDNANGGLAVWICAVGIIFITFSFVYGLHLYRGRSSTMWYCLAEITSCLVRFILPMNSKLSELSPSINQFENCLNQLLYAIIFPIAIFSVMVYLPLYGIFTVLFGSYENQYLWTVSACYLTGTIPVVILMVVSICALCGFRICLASISSNISAIVSKSEEISTSKPKTISVWIVQIVTIIFVFAIVALANGSFVFALTQNISVNGMTLVTIALSVFKVASGVFVIHGLPNLSSMILRTFQIEHAPNTVVFGASVTAFLMIANNVIVPYLVNMIIDPSCFYYAITSPPVVSVSYMVAEGSCNFYQWYNEQHRICYPNYIVKESFYSSFSYSNQCSSALITSFVYVFILRYIISGILLPGTFLFLERLCCFVYKRSLPDEHDCGSNRKMSWVMFWSKFIVHITPYRLRPIQYFVDFHKKDFELDVTIASTDSNRTTSKSYITTDRTFELESATINPIFEEYKDIPKIDIQDNILNQNSEVASSKRLRSLFGIHCFDYVSKTVAASFPPTFLLCKFVPSRKELIVKFVSDIAIMLTYGVQFPLLNIIIAVSCLFEVRMLYLVYMHRVNTIVRRFPELLSLQLIDLEKDLLHFQASVHKILRFLPFLATIFLLYSLFDILASSSGDARLFWILLLLPCGYLFSLYWNYKALYHCFLFSGSSSKATIVSDDVLSPKSISGDCFVEESNRSIEMHPLPYTQKTKDIVNENIN